MKNDNSDLPALARDFIDYHVSVRGHSEKTAIGYANDLRVFYRCLVTRRGLDAAEIHTLGADFLTHVDLRELYAFQSFSMDGSTVSASTRCRRTSCIKSYFNYLRRIGVLSQDPTVDLETPKRPASLPAYWKRMNASGSWTTATEPTASATRPSSPCFSPAASACPSWSP